MQKMNTANGVLLLCLLLSMHCSTQASGRIPGLKRDPSRLNRMPAAYGKREIRLEPAFLATLRSENLPLQEKRVGVLDRMPMSFGKRHNVINVKRSKYSWDENSPQMVSDSELIRQIFATRVLNANDS